MLDPIQFSLLLLLFAAVVLYVGSRLLWEGVVSAGLWRGVVMSGPLIALGLVQSLWSPATAVALMVSAAMLVLTLGLGVSTLDVPNEQAGASALLRLPLPLAATVCLAGFHGELSWPIAAALAVVGGLSLWTADGESEMPQRLRFLRLHWPFALAAVAVLTIGLVVLAVSTWLFRRASGSGAPTPVVVLMTVPAVSLGLLGLLTAEARTHRPDTPQETAVGLALATLGVGLPAVILAGHAWQHLSGRVTHAMPFVAKFASTQPAAAPVLMPLSTWRVDSVLLVVVSVLLLPIGTGRMKLGRVEGVALIVLFLAYAAVATRTGTLSG